MIHIIKGLSFWLVALYIGYSLRFVAGGQLLMGSLACCMFGCSLFYLVEIPKLWQKKHKVGAFWSLYLAGWFMYLWYVAMKAVNVVFLTGVPHFIKDSEAVGIFGIQGFWGVGIIVPLYVAAIVCILAIILPIFDWFEYRSTYNKDDYYAGKVFIDSIFEKEKKNEEVLS